MKTIKNLVLLFFMGLTVSFAQDPHREEEPYADAPPKWTKVQNIGAVKAVHAAFEKGDMPAFFELLPEDMVWNEAEGLSYADKNPYIGKQSIFNGVFVRIGGDWEYFKISDLQVYGMENNMVMATGYYNAKHKRTDKIIKAQMAHLWWLNNRKLVKFQQYVDTKQISDALIR